MDDSEARKEIDRLIKEIEKYNFFYFQKGEALISDYEYDCLLEQLHNLEEKYPEYKLKNSPNEIIGENVIDGFEKVEHEIPMLSLKKTYSFEELESFFANIENVFKNATYICELKLDGISIDAWYKDGILKNISTRGNGKIGDDVTRNKYFIRNIPERITGDVKDIHIRGEILMTFKDFNDANEELRRNNGVLLSNPRNATSGTIKSLNMNYKELNRNLTVFFYSIVFENKKKIIGINTQEETLKYLKMMNFPICDEYEFCENKEKVFDFIKKYEKLKDKLDFPIDGIVVKLNELKYYDELGCTSKNPRWAIAYKYKPEAISTRLVNVEFSVGKSGIITPVANFEPIKLGGTIIKKATLHNELEMQKLDIRENDKILIKKGGEIIPKIIGVDIIGRNVDNKRIKFVEKCPRCGCNLLKRNDFWYCINGKCKGRIAAILRHFVSQEAMNIKNIGEKAIELFIDRGLVNKISDLYRLKYRDLIRLPGYGILSSQKVIEEIGRSKEKPFKHVLYSLGIDGVGKVIAEKICEKLENIDNIIMAELDDFVKIDLVGDEIANNIIKFFKNQENINIIKELKTFGIQLENK